MKAPLRSFVCGSAGMCLAISDGASACLLARGQYSIMSRTVGMAIGVVLFVLFFASIGARFSRPVSAASAPTSTQR
jgi:hypothetical protein